MTLDDEVHTGWAEPTDPQAIENTVVGLQQAGCSPKDIVTFRASTLYDPSFRTYERICHWERAFAALQAGNTQQALAMYGIKS